MTKTALTLLGVLLCPAVSAISQDNAPQVNGVIWGVVLDENNQPAKGIGISVTGPPGKSSPRRLSGVKTDQSGHYRIGELSGWGTYTVYAEDWAAGYSTFVNSKFHEITISPEHREAELNFRLPPKAGFLDFHLTNRKTGEGIDDLVVSVRSAGKESDEVRSISQSTTQPVLVYPDKDLIIHVTSHGFHEWSGSVGRGLPVRVKSGNHMKVDVQLEPVSDGKAVHNIELTEPEDIADAAAVSTAIGILVKDAAASCPASPLEDREACVCSFKDDLNKLKSAYAAAVKKHPGWNEADSVVAYPNAAKQKSITLSFRGIERKLNGCAKH